ncbi:MAG TPA: SRPBCC family protein [Acidimicrobiales bacterium]|nr:SRPBCC family protein [Acidimicrobiales bacterium]
MQEHSYAFEVEATPEEIWAVLHPKIRQRPPGERRLIEHGDVRIEIVNEGDENGQGLVRTCTFKVPKLLLSGGVGRSWECVVEVRPNEFSRYEAVGKPLWSKASGWHRVEAIDATRSRVEFGETYHAFNPILRVALERYVHRFISKDNDVLVRTAIEQGVAARRARQA